MFTLCLKQQRLMNSTHLRETLNLIFQVRGQTNQNKLLRDWEELAKKSQDVMEQPYLLRAQIPEIMTFKKLVIAEYFIEGPSYIETPPEFVSFIQHDKLKSLYLKYEILS